MERKRFAKALLFPPLGIILLLVAASAAALVTVFVKGMDTSPLAYISYAFAFYTLCILYCGNAHHIVTLLFLLQS